MAGALRVEWWGRVPYAEALARQERAVAARRRGEEPDRLLLLEHPPVVTLGRRADGSTLRTPREALEARGVPVLEVARGGDVTWHGPGQLVGYPILDLAARGEADVRGYLRRLEAVLVEALSALGVSAATLEGKTGVFVAGAEPPRKLASIGVGLRGWVSYHGFALNATPDLSGFADIVPCGLHDVTMTSVAAERGLSPERALFDATRAAVAGAFEEHFG